MNFLKLYERNKSWLKFKYLALFGSSAIAMVLILNTTYAWFTSSDKIVNDFTGRTYNFQVNAVDIFQKPSYPIYPGGSAEKVVGAINQGDIEAFVRILVLPTIISSSGEALPANLGKEVLLYYGEDELDLIAMDPNAPPPISIPPSVSPKPQWAYTDGYFYFLTRLGPGEEEILFEQVRLNPNLDPAKYENATLKIDISCESVGSATNAYRQAWWNLDPNLEPSDASLKKIDDRLQNK
jgi:predicted ribosomally synthesized peptide with SipW-like signal peptide